MPKNRENRDYKRERENLKLLARKTVLYNAALEITTRLASEKKPTLYYDMVFLGPKSKHSLAESSALRSHKAAVKVLSRTAVSFEGSTGQDLHSSSCG